MIVTKENFEKLYDLSRNFDTAVPMKNGDNQARTEKTKNTFLTRKAIHYRCYCIDEANVRSVLGFQTNELAKIALGSLIIQHDPRSQKFFLDAEKVDRGRENDLGLSI